MGSAVEVLSSFFSGLAFRLGLVGDAGLWWMDRLADREAIAAISRAGGSEEAVARWESGIWGLESWWSWR